MRSLVLFGSDPIAFLSCLGKFKNGCKLNRVPEYIAARCVRIHIKEQSKSHLLNLLTTNSTAVDSKSSKMLQKHWCVLDFFLQTYAAYKVMVEA